MFPVHSSLSLSKRHSLLEFSVDIVVRSQYEESSLQLALDMFGLLTEQTAIVVERHLKTRATLTNPDTSPPIFNSWLRHVFPSLKIFTDWMTCNANTFIPLPDQLPAEFGPHPDILMSLAKVINRIRTIDRTHIQLGSNLPSKTNVVLFFFRSLILRFSSSYFGRRCGTEWILSSIDSTSGYITNHK